MPDTIISEGPKAAIGNWMTGLGTIEKTPDGKSDVKLPDNQAKAEPLETNEIIDDYPQPAKATTEGMRKPKTNASSTDNNPNEDTKSDKADESLRNKSSNPGRPSDRDVRGEAPSGNTGNENDEPDGPSESWPRSRKDWDKFKSARKIEREKLEAKVKESEDLRKELEISRSTAAVPADYETIKKERDDFLNIIKIEKVEKHPRFQTYFGDKFNQQHELAKVIVGQEIADGIVSILKMNDPKLRAQKLEDVTSGLSTMKAAQLGGVLSNITMIENERSQAISEAGTTFENMTRAEKAAEQAKNLALQQSSDKAFQTEIARAQDPKTGLPVFQKRDGDTAWNGQVDAIIKVTKNLLASGGALAPEDTVRAAMYAASYPQLLGWAKASINERDAKIAKLESQVTALTAARPGIRPGQQPSQDAPNSRQALKAGTRPMQAGKSLVDLMVKEWSPS